VCFGGQAVNDGLEWLSEFLPELLPFPLDVIDDDGKLLLFSSFSLVFLCSLQQDKMKTFLVAPLKVESGLGRRQA